MFSSSCQLFVYTQRAAYSSNEFAWTKFCPGLIQKREPQKSMILQDFPFSSGLGISLGVLVLQINSPNTLGASGAADSTDYCLQNNNGWRIET